MNTSQLIERRWFAAGHAAAEIQTECEALAHVMDLVQDAWRSARARLRHLEALRDALGEELSAIEEHEPQHASAAQRSAA